MVEMFNMTRNELIAKVNKTNEQNAKLEDVLLGLIDGLDANYDERCGLTNDQWQERIKAARLALGGE